MTNGSNGGAPEAPMGGQPGYAPQGAPASEGMGPGYGHSGPPQGMGPSWGPGAPGPYYGAYGGPGYGPQGGYGPPPGYYAPMHYGYGPMPGGMPPQGPGAYYGPMGGPAPSGHGGYGGAGGATPNAAHHAGMDSGLASFFNFRDERFLRGAITGAALTFLLTNEGVQKNTIRSLVRMWSTLQGGFEEMKERFQDAEAEVQAEQHKDQ